MPGNRSRSGQRGPAPEPERRRCSSGPQGTQSCSPRRPPPPPPQADGHPRAAGDGPPGSPRDRNEEEAPRGGHAWRGSRRGNGLGAAGVSLQRAGRVQRRRVTRQAADRLEHLAAQANPTPGEDIPGGWSLRQLRGQAEPPLLRPQRPLGPLAGQQTPGAGVQAARPTEHIAPVPGPIRGPGREAGVGWPPPDLAGLASFCSPAKWELWDAAGVGACMKLLGPL